MSGEGPESSKSSKKQQKKEDKKQKKTDVELDYRTLPVEAIKVFLSSNEDLNLKVAIVASHSGATFIPIRSSDVPSYPLKPALMHNQTQIFGASNICRYFKSESSDVNIDDLINFEEFSLTNAVNEGMSFYLHLCKCFGKREIGVKNNHSFNHDGLRIVEVHIF